MRRVRERVLTGEGGGEVEAGVLDFVLFFIFIFFIRILNPEKDLHETDRQTDILSFFFLFLFLFHFSSLFFFFFLLLFLFFFSISFHSSIPPIPPFLAREPDRRSSKL